VLAPVEVGGVRIGLATLHNEEDLARKDLRAGEDVIVLRAGDVIPQVVSRRRTWPSTSVVPRGHTRRRHCPFCNTRTIKPQDGVFTKCPNPVCPARLWQLLKHFRLARSDGHRRLGEKQVALLQEHQLVETAGDFYRLTAEELVGLEGFAELSVKNLLQAIEASKERPFARVLFALGIERSVR